MSKKAYASYTTRTTPQSEPIPGSAQVKNSAGGYAFALDDWKRLERFLVLGSDGPSYYASARTLTKENAEAVLRCLQADGARAVALIAAVSEAGRAPKNDPALFALAMAAGLGDERTRRAALEALPRVARIGTHLFSFVTYVAGFRGWGRGLRAAVGGWFAGKDPDALAYQAIKYQQRDGWSHADLLRLTHPKAESGAKNALYRWIVDGAEGVALTDGAAESLPRLVVAFETLKHTTDPQAAARLIAEHRLPREAVPTELLNHAAVWEALLADMPMTALIRNLGKMTAVGLVAPLSDAARRVAAQLGDAERLRRARVHPLAVLIAAKVYEQGHGEKGSLSWAPVAPVVDALDGAYYAAFGTVEPSGKRLYLGLDISGSMWGSTVAGTPLSAAVASGAMAMVTVRTEPEHYAAGFTSTGGNFWTGGTAMTPIAFSAKQRLDDVLRKMKDLERRMGGTDCALPMLDALEKKLQVDAFVIYTDSETWAGKVHPTQALRQYREATGIPAKMVVVGMVSNGFTIADPTDGGNLDVCGFDTATPQLITDFVAGRV